MRSVWLRKENSMKNKSKFAICAALIAVCALVLCACDFNVYDKPDKLKGSSSSYSATYYNVFNRLDEYEGRIKNFTGVANLYDLEVTDGVISVEYDISVTGGRFKIIATDGNEIYTIAEGTSSGKSDVKVNNGSYRLRIVGDDANVTLYLKI